MSVVDDGHDPKICNYNFCGSGKPGCPFVREDVEEIIPYGPDEHILVVPPPQGCNHDWQLVEIIDHKEPVTYVFFCTHCLELVKKLATP